MTPSHPKVPRAPRQPLVFAPNHLLDYEGPLFRIHTVRGPHPMQWNQYRTYGPLDSARWDPHPPPPRNHPSLGVMYAASTSDTAFAEVFQRSRLIDTDSDRVLSGWTPARPLRLLDLTSNWPIQNHAASALQHAPRSTCRAWACEIKNQGPPDLDGLLVESTLTGADTRVIVLWTGRPGGFPTAPELSRGLDDPALAPIVLSAVQQTGYGIA